MMQLFYLAATLTFTSLHLTRTLVEGLHFLREREGAVTVRATTRRAATVSIKMMRFMRYFLSLPHPPNGLWLKPSQVGCVFAGAGRIVCMP